MSDGATTVAKRVGGRVAALGFRSEPGEAGKLGRKQRRAEARTLAREFRRSEVRAGRKAPRGMDFRPILNTWDLGPDGQTVRPLGAVLQAVEAVNLGRKKRGAPPPPVAPAPPPSADGSVLAVAANETAAPEYLAAGE